MEKEQVSNMQTSTLQKALTRHWVFLDQLRGSAYEQGVGVSAVHLVNLWGW